MLWNTLKSLFSREPEPVEEPLPDRALRLIREKRVEEARALIEPHLDTNNPAPELLALMGEIQYHLKHRETAERLFLDALHRKQGLAEAHYGLSLIYYDAGRMEDALAQAQYSRNLQPNTTRFLAQLGLCYIALKGFGQARDVLRHATLLEPENVPALNNLGIALHALGGHGEALYFWRRALALNPDYAPAKQNLATAQPVDHTEAAASAGPNPDPGESDQPSTMLDREIPELERAQSESPADPDIAASLVRRYIRALRLEDAMDVLHIAQAHQPADTTLMLLQAQIAHRLGQLNHAHAYFRKVLRIEPDHVEALLGLSQVLRDAGKVDEAIEPIEHAVEITETQDSLIQLSFAQVNACRYEDALETCDRIEAAWPDAAPILYTSRAICHSYLGQFEAASHWLALAQQYPPAAKHLEFLGGMISLLHEDYPEGWAGYRLRAVADGEHQRLLPYPRWQGESLAGKTILVLAEQGLGDQVMFASCLPDLQRLGPANILLESHERVVKTIARSFPGIRVFSSDQIQFDWLPVGETPDYYTPIADLPFFFRQHKEDFPEHPGYLVADSERVAHWRERIGNGRPRVGISWRGGVQRTRQFIRTLSLDQLLPILSERRVHFVNLQYGDVTGELARFAEKSRVEIVNFPEAIADLDEFAALVSSLDLVISVCNTTVHYAGALGKHCWVLTPHVPEWRYGVTAPRMRWYPSTRMFRQPRPGDWDTVLSQARIALTEWLSAQRSTAGT